MDADGKRYHQACGVARALEVVGDRWTLLIVRDLLMGPLRFADLELGLPGLATNLLAARLKRLQAAGVVDRHRLARPGAGYTYQLTAAGRSLEPAVLALGAWGLRHGPAIRPDDQKNVRWALLGMLRRFRGADGAARLGVSDGVRNYVVDVDAEHRTIAEAPLTGCDAVVRGTDGLLLWATGRVGGVQAEAAGMLEVTGDRAAWLRVVDAFPVPA